MCKITIFHQYTIIIMCMWKQIRSHPLKFFLPQFIWRYFHTHINYNFKGQVQNFLSSFTNFYCFAQGTSQVKSHHSIQANNSPLTTKQDKLFLVHVAMSKSPSRILDVTSNCHQWLGSLTFWHERHSALANIQLSSF